MPLDDLACQVGTLIGAVACCTPLDVMGLRAHVRDYSAD